MVTLKAFSVAADTTFGILADDSWAPCLPSTSQLPPQIVPPGLSSEWQWYLHRDIREFYQSVTEDLVCLLPSAPCSAVAGSAGEEKPSVIAGEGK